MLVKVVARSLLVTALSFWVVPAMIVWKIDFISCANVFDRLFSKDVNTQLGACLLELQRLKPFEHYSGAILFR
jgi:hypothetical protein